jgi:hypothetical protein
VSDTRLVIYTDSETAGVVQDQITRDGLDDEFEVKYHPWMPQGMLAVDHGGRLEVHSAELVTRCYAGLAVLRPPPLQFVTGLPAL